MVSPPVMEKVAELLYAKGYVDVYAFLTASLDNLRSRATLLDRNIKEFERKLKDIIERANADPETMNSEDRETSLLFKELHYTELEIIQQINILIELLAVYYHGTRKDLRELPTSIGKYDFSQKQLCEEFEYFNNQSQSDIWNNFKLPDAAKFTELSKEEQNELKQLLEESARKTLEAFREIFRFQKNFRTVYNKYKHTLSEFTGVFSLDKASRIIRTTIYIRHKENGKICTYIIPSSREESQYFTKVSARIYEMLRTLIDNILLFIVNGEKDFIPRTLFIDKTNETKFIQIASKVRSSIMPNFGAKMIVNPPSEESREGLNKRFKEDFIYKMDKDIIDPNVLLKGQLLIS